MIKTEYIELIEEFAQFLKQKHMSKKEEPKETQSNEEKLAKWQESCLNKKYDLTNYNDYSTFRNVLSHDLDLAKKIITNQKLDLNIYPTGLSIPLMPYFRDKDSMGSDKKREILLFLLDNGANIKCTYFISSTLRQDFNLFHYACLDKDLPLIDALIKKGIDINTLDENGNNALRSVQINDSFEVAQLLVKNGININHIKKKKNTYLTSFMMRSNRKIAKLLLDNGANPNDISFSELYQVGGMSLKKEVKEYLKNYEEQKNKIKPKIKLKLK